MRQFLSVPVFVLGVLLSIVAVLIERISSAVTGLAFCIAGGNDEDGTHRGNPNREEMTYNS